MNERQAQQSSGSTVCKLCKLPRPLRDSHVISEFLYQSMYDEKHRFHSMSVGEYPELEQKGLREPLLCPECETKISVWEGYAKLLFSGQLTLTFKKEKAFTWVGGINYEAFKLFQLSILWRAGVATQPFFSGVTLGPHEEKIRMMLLRGVPGEADRYGCLMWEIRLQGKVSTVIIQPTAVRILSVRGFRFTFGGFFWAYAVASHRLPVKFRDAIVQPSGRMLIASRNLEEAPFLQQLVARLQGRPESRRP